MCGDNPFMTATNERLLKGLSLLTMCGPLGERGTWASTPTATPYLPQRKGLIFFLSLSKLSK